MVVLSATMDAVPIIKKPVPRKASSHNHPRSKSPTLVTYSHLLYLSDAERQQCAPRMEKSSSASIRSLGSVRSSESAWSSNKSPASISTAATSRQSIHIPGHVDNHYPLITTVHPENIPASVRRDHPALACARHMAQIHNTVIRALNASWNHAVAVPPGTREASDFLFFNQVLYHKLDRHHRVEDEYMIPALENLLEKPGALEANTKGHQSFAEGLEIFRRYVFVTKSAEYNGTTLRHIIESFAPDLIQHLHDEIPSLSGLHTLDPKDLMKVWKETDRLATKVDSLYTDVPWILGCQDRDFTIDGERCTFPEVPWIMEAVVRNLHAKKHAGAWKFCPSDLTGKRRLLPIA